MGGGGGAKNAGRAAPAALLIVITAAHQYVWRTSNLSDILSSSSIDWQTIFDTEIVLPSGKARQNSHLKKTRAAEIPPAGSFVLNASQDKLRESNLICKQLLFFFFF